MPKIRISKKRGGSKKKLIRYSPREKYDFMKNFRIVKYWALKRYNISSSELEMLLHLYSYDLFTRADFQHFEGLLSWDKDRWREMQKKGWIVVWRDHKGYKGEKKLYVLSVGMKRLCANFYKKLLQEEPIPETWKNNPVFRGGGYQDKIYRKAIQKMNAERQARLDAEKEMV